tara:strand:+ start:1739 stop:5461 length:3723 start_codon:yes stop_codon:yes gene_type:complete
MATKKYISPDVFPTTIRDNFRKLMGQHYVVQTDGTATWNPEAVAIPNPGPAGFLVSDPVTVRYVPPSLSIEPTNIMIERITNTDGVPFSLEYGLSRDASKGLGSLKIKVKVDNQNYSSIYKFTEDLDYIFQNPEKSDNGGFYYDRTFECSLPDAPDYSSYSQYNYLVESYESITKNTKEAILPNHYNIAIIERAGDEATFVSDVTTGTEVVIPTPGSLVGDTGVVAEPLQDTKDHTLLLGRLDDSLIKDQGLFSESYVESEFLSSGGGLTIEEYLLADLDKTLDLKYVNYYKSWSNNYVDLLSDEQSSLEEKGKNIIFSGLLGTSLIRESLASQLPTQNKLPYYSALKFVPQTYTGASAGTLSSTPINSIASEIRSNLLYSTFGSHIAGIYDPDYNDASALTFTTDGLPVPNPKYAFVNKSFYDNSNSIESNLSLSPELHDYAGYAASTINANSVNSVNWAISWHGVSGLGGAAEAYSPVTTFSTDKKLFIDMSAGAEDLELETDLALRFSEDFPTAPLPLQALAINNFVFQTTQMTLPNSTMTPALSNVYGPGAIYGFYNQLNASFFPNGSADSFGLPPVGRMHKGSFEDGQPSYSETVMYRVAKYAGTNTNTQPIQNIWIPSEIGDRSSGIEYIDSQVKYGEQYTYQVSEFKYVFGLKYRYERTKEPEPSLVETVLDADGTTLGYIIKWAGFANLFDDWEEAIGEIPSSPDPMWATYATLYNPSYEYEEGDVSGAPDAPGYNEENSYFVSTSRLNEILQVSWNLNPSAGDAEISGFLNDHATRVPSWRDIFGGGWSYDITPDTPTTGVSSLFAEYMFTGDIARMGALDPSTFSVEEWLMLWFGADNAGGGTEDGRLFRFRIAPFARSGTLGFLTEYGSLQAVPPSHHIYRDATLSEWNYRSLDSPKIGYLTGFGRLTSHSIDNGVPPSDVSFVVNTDSSVSSVDTLEGSSVELSGYEAEYAIHMHPVAEIVEVPYFTTTTSVLSKPPPPPEVSITPYRGVNDTLILSISSNNIEFEQYPIPIEEGDAEMFEMHRQAQGVLPGDKIKFIQDDTTAFFQIYRMDKPPLSYSDFAGKLRNTLSTVLSSEGTIIRTNSVAHDERLQPNIKYYYMFRSVDYHNNFSNPTSVLEVELVDDAGAIYLLVKPYEFPVEINSVPSVDMKKFIQVTPALAQVTAEIPTNMSYTDPSDIPKVELGSESIGSLDRIWDKKFKIRLTSKKTGKKLDFNLTFDKQDKRIKTT